MNNVNVKVLNDNQILIKNDFFKYGFGFDSWKPLPFYCDDLFGKSVKECKFLNVDVEFGREEIIFEKFDLLKRKS